LFFDMDHVEELVESLTALEPLPPSARPIAPVPEPIPPAVDRLVLRCLAVDPSKRFDSAADLSAAFTEAMSAVRGRPVTPVRRPKKRSTSERLAQQSRRIAVTVDDEVDPANSLEEALRAAGAHGFDSETALVTPEPSLRRVWVVGGALVLALLLSLAGWTLFKGRDKEPASPGAEARRGMTAEPTPGSERQYRLVSVPPAARILRGVTREDIGQTPHRVRVSRGSPELFVLRLPGYRESRVVIQYGDPDPVRVELQREPDTMDSDPPTMHPGMAPMRRVVILGGGLRPRPMAHIVRLTPPPGMQMDAPLPMQRVTEQGIVDPFRK
jgi:hypothetical protein